MTLKPVARSSLRFQRGGREQRGAAELRDKRAEEGEEEMDGRMEEICIWGSEQKHRGEIWGAK